MPRRLIMRPDAIRRIGADALERLVLSELRRLSHRPELAPDALPTLLRRLELRPSDTQLVLDQEALFGLDHPELALEDLKSRLASGERVVVEPGPSPALRILLPRRMQLRGGRTWTLVDGDASPRLDRPLIGALRRGHELLREAKTAAPKYAYQHKLIHLAMLSPELQRMILQGRQPAELTLAKLLRCEMPMSWAEQLSWLREAART